MSEIRSWHHGLVARWWAEFNHDGEDIEYFREIVRRSGEPVLDVGCGTGRVLLPLLRDGVDIEGTDASGDMLDWCRRAAAESGFPVDLTRQAIHELDRPRRYRTIIVCGAFGLGATRAQDLAGLRLLRRHLAPGGTLVLDHHLPNLEHPQAWTMWSERPELPQPWPDRGMLRRASDGSDLELRIRIAALDPLEQTTTLEIRVRHLVGGDEVAAGSGLIDINLYLKREIELMLDVAGFDDVAVTGFPGDGPPRPWAHERVVFHARVRGG